MQRFYGSRQVPGADPGSSPAKGSLHIQFDNAPAGMQAKPSSMMIASLMIRIHMPLLPESASRGLA